MVYFVLLQKHNAVCACGARKAVACGDPDPDQKQAGGVGSGSSSPCPPPPWCVCACRQGCLGLTHPIPSAPPGACAYRQSCLGIQARPHTPIPSAALVLLGPPRRGLDVLVLLQAPVVVLFLPGPRGVGGSGPVVGVVERLAVIPWGRG